MGVMRVLFVYTNINGYHADSFADGIAIMMAVTKKAGHDIRHSQIFTKEDYSLIERDVKEFKPDVVGFTAVSSQYSVVTTLAEMVKKIIGPQVSIKTTSTDDNRSYHVSSQKIKSELGFEAKHSVEDAISDLKKAFKEGRLPDSLDDIRYFNIKTMQALNMK